VTDVRTRCVSGRRDATPSLTPVSTSSAYLLRRCSCGQHTGGGECEECKKKNMPLQRHSDGSMRPAIAPTIVQDVLRSPGQPLDAAARAIMKSHIGHDFSHVRVHTDANAVNSARAVNALAYTVGRDIVFAQDQYRPATRAGRQLLAHELTHVVQQDGSHGPSSVDQLTLDAPDSPTEKEARKIGAEIFAGGPVAEASSVQARPPASTQLVSRADPNAVALTMNLGRTPQTGLQFWPTGVTDTRVGPVTAQGGLLSEQASRLNVIIGENLSPRTLARQLLPLWLTATPFTPAGAASPLPLDIITEDELARGLLVYNQFYLPVPAMTNWRSGLRFPLPVEIERTTGVATLHPGQIRALSAAFLPAWAPLLDRRAAATAAPPAATLNADVAAFLVAHTTPLARGVQLGARALTNAVAELPFIRETFRQLGAGAFDVALAFMENLLVEGIGLLAAQRDGAAILAAIRNALAAPPHALTAAQQASLTRVNAALTGTAAVAPPGATRSRAEKTVTLDTVKLDGSNRDPATDVALANGILAECNVRLQHNANLTATPAETVGWIGADLQVQTGDCGSGSADQRHLGQQATARFGLASRIRAFYVQSVSSGARAESCIPAGAVGYLSRVSWITNSATGRTLGHEVGHILLNSGAHPAGTTNIMSPTNQAPVGETVTNPQCTTIYNNA
jgi:Domain of unknown function (DUF4157)